MQRLVPLAFRHGLRQVASTTTLGLPKHLASYRISHVPAIDWLLAVKVQSREWLPTVHVQPLSREWEPVVGSVLVIYENVVVLIKHSSNICYTLPSPNVLKRPKMPYYHSFGRELVMAAVGGGIHAHGLTFIVSCELSLIAYFSSIFIFRYSLFGFTLWKPGQPLNSKF